MSDIGEDKHKQIFGETLDAAPQGVKRQGRIWASTMTSAARACGLVRGLPTETWLREQQDGLRERDGEAEIGGTVAIEAKSFSMKGGGSVPRLKKCECPIVVDNAWPICQRAM